VFLLGILSLSLFYRKGPIFLATFLYTLIWIFFFLPYQEIEKVSNEDMILIVFYFLTAIFTGLLTDRAKNHKEMLEKRERSLEILYDIVRNIADATSLKDVLLTVKNGLGSALGGHCEIIIKDIDNGLIYDESTSFSKNEKEKGASNWVFQNGKEAGWSTSTLPFSENLYIPLKGLKEVVGVLAYHPKQGIGISIEEKNFLYTVAHQLANYIERSFSDERVRKYEEHKQVEKTYESILNLISDLFEGPLMCIQDGVKELKGFELPKKSSEIDGPIERIHVSSESLARILENITAMVNLNAGLTPVNRSMHDLKELIVTSMTRVKKTLTAYNWMVKIDDDIPSTLFDYDLIELLFYNLVFHAVEFSPPESTIEIIAKQMGDYILMSISGEGATIPPEMLEVVFEKFYRVPGTTTSGLGLGLAIAKTIAEVHNGELRVKNRLKGGISFSLYLPINASS